MSTVRALVPAAVLCLLTGLLGAGVTTTTASAASDASTPGGPVADASGAPVTVPAVQQWQPGGTGFVLPTGLLLVEVDARYADRLLADAHTFADDLHTLTGRQVRVRTADDWSPAGAAGEPGIGSIRLTLDPGRSSHGPEQYTATVDGAVTLSGATSDGVFAGTRTVLQLLRQSPRIPGGTVTDWPSYS